jgi:hypothetical protein
VLCVCVCVGWVGACGAAACRRPTLRQRAGRPPPALRCGGQRPRRRRPPACLSPAPPRLPTPAAGAGWAAAQPVVRSAHVRLRSPWSDPSDPTAPPGHNRRTGSPPRRAAVARRRQGVGLPLQRRAGVRRGPLQALLGVRLARGRRRPVAPRPQPAAAAAAAAAVVVEVEVEVAQLSRGRPTTAATRSCWSWLAAWPWT